MQNISHDPEVIRTRNLRDAALRRVPNVCYSHATPKQKKLFAKLEAASRAHRAACILARSQP